MHNVKMDNKMVYTKETLKKLATDILGDRNKAEQWLATPIKALNEKTPQSLVENTEGIEEVVVILRKIKAGEFT